MVVEFIVAERDLLVTLLTVEIVASKFPLSPRIEAVKRIRAKVEARAIAPAGRREPKSSK